MTADPRPSLAPAPAPSADERLRARLRAHLAHVLASRAFANAPVQQRFLRFVVEETLDGRGGDLKEFVVASAVFGRGATYDPHEDAAVRVAARRLRQKLHEYYEDEGRADDLRILLHPGSYRPEFAEPAPPSPPPPAEVTPREAHGGTPAPAAPALAGRRRLPIVLAAAVVVAAVGAGWWWLAAGAWTRPHVVAVLPFQNATADASNEHVGFGLVEELTTRLARTPGLRVVARTSSAQFPSGADVRDVARRLGATTLIEGSIRGDGARLRIAVQLVSGRDGAHLWAQAYDREPSDLLGMQEDVAGDVAAAVGERLLGDRAQPAAPFHAPSPAAVAAYWQGRYQRSLRTPAHRRRSLELFEAAIAADPRFAPALAAAGEVEATMAFHQELPTAEGVARARAHSRQAIAIDEGLGQAHVTLAWVAFFFDHDWPAAERGFRRALALNPSDAGAHQLYAQGLASQGRLAEAVAASETAARLDPLSYATSADLGVMLYLARRYDDCIARVRPVLEANPTATGLNGVLGACHIARGNFAAGVRHVEAFLDRFGRVSFAIARQGQALAGLGDLDHARRLFAELDALAGQGEAQFTHLAMLAAALGDTDRALTALATALDRREADAAFLAVEPAFDPLRRDPRFADLLRRLRPPA